MRPLERVLFATDYSKASRYAFEHAVALAARSGAALHIVHVAGAGEPDANETEAQSVSDAAIRAVLDRLAPADVDWTPWLQTKVHRDTLMKTEPAVALAEYARRQQIGLLVVGTHGRRNLAHVLLGSVAEHVVRLADCPVWVVGRGDRHALRSWRPQRVLAAIDFSEPAKQALQQAAVLCRGDTSKLIALNALENAPNPVFNPFSDVPLRQVSEQMQTRAQQALEALLNQLPEAPHQTHAMVLQGRAHHEIVRAAREHDADLIVMGPTGVSAIERVLLGTVTGRVLRTAPCPVFVTRGEPLEI